MKRVSFETAKALKDAGYPQECNVHIPYYDWDGQYHYGSEIGAPRSSFYSRVYAPTYIDAWLWLWRVKNIQLEVNGICDYHKPFMFVGCDCGTLQLGGITTEEFKDPEEAIIAAIEILVTNNLIK